MAQQSGREKSRGHTMMATLKTSQRMMARRKMGSSDTADDVTARDMARGALRY